MKKGRAYLLPSPERSETVKETNVLKQIRVQPQSRRNGEHGNDEEDEAEDGHGEECANQPQHTHTQVPDTQAQLHRPQREHDEGEYNDQRTDSVQLLHDLRAFIQPYEV